MSKIKLTSATIILILFNVCFGLSQTDKAEHDCSSVFDASTDKDAELKDILFEGTKDFQKLKYLDLSNAHLSTLPSEINKLTQLKVLDLSGNDFTFLPKEIMELKNLEEINLNADSELDLEQAFSVLSQLPNLKILHLDNLGYAYIPGNLSSLSHLRQLTLRNDHLTSTPDAITQLSKLRMLDLSGNYITELPGDFANLRKLRVMLFSNTELLNEQSKLMVTDQLTKLKVIECTPISQSMLALKQSDKYTGLKKTALVSPLAEKQVNLKLDYVLNYTAIPKTKSLGFTF